MKSMRALIVDDERLARSEMIYLLREHPDVVVAGEAESVAQAADLAAKLRPDLVFLDVQMPGQDGFDLLRFLAFGTRVVFVTAHDRFAVRAFEVNAVDYLMKPVSPARLREALARVVPVDESHPAQGRLDYDDSVLVVIDRAPRLIPLASIVAIFAEGDYTKIVCVTGSLGLVLKPLKEWEAVLPERHFARVQRSVIVNCGYVERFDPLCNGALSIRLKHLPSPVPMSRRYARRFRDRFAV